MIIGAALFGPWKSVGKMLAEPWFYGWAAALATGSVGWGAFRYAREAHNLRISEVNETRKRQYSLDLAAYNEWRNRIVSLKAGGSSYRKLDEKYDLNTQPLRVHLDVLRTCISTTSPNGVTTTHFALQPNMLGPLFGLNGATMFFRSCCEVLIARCSSLDLDARPPASIKKELDTLMRIAVDIEKDASDILKLIRTLHPRNQKG